MRRLLVLAQFTGLSVQPLNFPDLILISANVQLPYDSLHFRPTYLNIFLISDDKPVMSIVKRALRGLSRFSNNKFGRQHPLNMNMVSRLGDFFIKKSHREAT